MHERIFNWITYIHNKSLRFEWVKGTPSFTLEMKERIHHLPHDKKCAPILMVTIKLYTFHVHVFEFAMPLYTDMLMNAVMATTVCTVYCACNMIYGRLSIPHANERMESGCLENVHQLLISLSKREIPVEWEKMQVFYRFRPRFRIKCQMAIKQNQFARNSCLHYISPN